MRLVGFAKVHREPGVSQPVEIIIEPAATHHPLSVWSVAEHAFVVLAGDFAVHVGTSSTNTTVAGTFTVA